MAIIPFATKRLIPPGSSDPRIKARMGILHVDAGNAETLYGWFSGPSGGIESHGFIKKTGVLEQYRDTGWQADANHNANDFALSFETQGFGAGEWTDEQLDTIKRVMLWAERVHGIPLRKVTSWNDPKGGWGYHVQFGAPGPWTPVAKSCPGPDRIKQFHDVLVPWMNAGGRMDVAHPTPNITAALKAGTRDDRRAALKRVVKHGSDDAQQAALAWLAALDAIERAQAKAKEARKDIRAEEGPRAKAKAVPTKPSEVRRFLGEIPAPEITAGTTFPDDEDEEALVIQPEEPVADAVVTVAPTQVRRPGRATLRTAFQALVALAVLAPILVQTAGLDPDMLPWLAIPLGVAAALTRVMALPQVEDFLREYLPFLAAAPDPTPAGRRRLERGKEA